MPLKVESVYKVTVTTLPLGCIFKVLSIKDKMHKVRDSKYLVERYMKLLHWLVSQHAREWL